MTTTPINPLVARAFKRWQASRVITPEVPVVVVIPDAPPLIDWIESEFYIPETNGPMTLAPYQKAVLKEATRQDADGHFVYDLVLWSDIKKSAKSTIAAAVTLYRALYTPWGSFKIVANDLEQANSRVFYYIERAIGLNPRITPLVSKRQYHLTFTNHAVIQAVPIDPSGEAGSNDDFIEFTELHGAKSKAQVRMWSEMTIPPNKHGLAQRWIDTYAGFSGEAPILENLYIRAVKEGKRLTLHDAPADLEVYANDRMIALWNTQPRLSWQTSSYYASESAILPENEFNRIHRNIWGTSTQTFVPSEWWAACRGDIPAFGKYREMVVAIDAAVSGDCFGIVGLSRRGDKVEVRYVRKWTPPPGRKIEYSNVDNVDDVAYPEGELRRLAKEYNVICFGFDEYQLHHLCTSLSNANVGYFKPFSQGADRLEADKQLYDVIRDRRIVHDGNPDLSEHIANANAKTEGDKLRIVKRSENLKIDLAVCASMATELAFELLPE